MAKTIPKAEPVTPEPELELNLQLTLGAPMAFQSGCALLEEEEGVPGAFASIECGKCETAFQVDLLDENPKGCPECKQQYTHCLMVSPVDDAKILTMALTDILAENGIEPEDFAEHIDNAIGLEDDSRTDDDAGDDESPNDAADDKS